MKIWQCSVCRYIHRGDAPPEKCPVCGVDSSKFVEITEADIPAKRKPGQKPAKASKAVTVPSPPPEPAKPKTGIDKIKHLLVKHHLHPISVHTPNGLLPVAALLWIMAWLFDSEILATTAMINQIFVVLSFPVVIYTGTLEWQKKYNSALTLIFKLKILAASLTVATCVITLVWYLINPQILSSSNSWVFIFFTVFMLGCAGAAGHIGGKLVFKD